MTTPTPVLFTVTNIILYGSIYLIFLRRERALQLFWKMGAITALIRVIAFLSIIGSSGNWDNVFSYERLCLIHPEAFIFYEKRDSFTQWDYSMFCIILMVGSFLWSGVFIIVKTGLNKFLCGVRKG